MRINYPEWIVVHHTGGTRANPLADTSHHTFEIVDNYHRGLWQFQSSLGYFIGYHYFIEKDGKITQGRSDSDEGAHTRGVNLKSIGICLAGNFDATLPTAEQVEALTKLLKELSVEHSIPVTKIVPHRKFAKKSCYGNKLPDNWAANLLRTDKRSPIKEYTTAELFIELQRRIDEMKRGRVA